MDLELKKTVANAAADAMDLLSQLGPLVWALHAKGGAVVPTALCIDFEPEEYVSIGTNESAKKKKERKDRVVCILNKLKKKRTDEHPALFTSDGYRDAINRSMVVYAAVVLERFLDKAGEPLWQNLGGIVKKCNACNHKFGWPHSFGGMVDCLKGMGVSLYDLDHYPQASLLAIYRHKIVHADARVDDKFLEDVAKVENESKKKLLFGLSKDKSSVCWISSGGIKLSKDWVNKKISLSIDEVILPLLKDSQAFVAEAAKKLREAV